MVILIDHVVLCVTKYIQIGGWLRKGDFYSKIHVTKKNVKLLNSKENINGQIKVFYGLMGNYMDSYDQELNEIAVC